MSRGSVISLTLASVLAGPTVHAQQPSAAGSPAVSAPAPTPRVVIGCVQATADGHFLLRSVSTTDTSNRTGVTVYRLEPDPGVRLRAHADHAVEIRGTLATLPDGAPPCCASLQGPSARSHEPEAKQPNAAAIGTAGRDRATAARETSSPAPLVLRVTAVRPVAATCRP